MNKLKLLRCCLVISTTIILGITLLVYKQIDSVGGEEKIEKDNWQKATISLINNCALSDGYYPFDLTINRRTSVEDSYNFIELATLTGYKSCINKRNIADYVIKNIKNENDLAVLLKLYLISINQNLPQIQNEQEEKIKTLFNNINFEDIDYSNIIYLYMQKLDIPEEKKPQIKNLLLNNIQICIKSKNYKSLYEIIYCLNILDCDLNQLNKKYSLIKYCEQEVQKYYNLNNINIVPIYYLHQILILLGNNHEIPISVINILCKQNPDGGISLDNTDLSHSLATLMTVKIVPIKHIELEKLMHYISTNQSPDGGFYAPKRFSSNLAASSLSILCLKRLDSYSEKSNDSNITNLKNQLTNYLITIPNISWHYVYYTLNALKELSNNDMEDIYKLVINAKVPETYNPRQYCYYVLTMDTIGIKVNANEDILRKLYQDVSTSNNIDFLYYCIEISNHTFSNTKLNIDADKIESVLITNMNNKGFCLPDGNTNIVTTYYAFNIIDMQNLQIKTKGINEILKYYESPLGGYCFSPNDAKTNSIISTYYGLELKTCEK